MCECVRGLVSFAMVNGHGRCSSVVGLSSERDLDYVRCVLTVCRRPVGCQSGLGDCKWEESIKTAMSD
jgi:hypothetical protein